MPHAHARLSRGKARPALLDAAHKLVRQGGWNATSVDDLCAEAGVTKGAFFHHFASKDELGVAAAHHWSAVTGALFANAPYHRHPDPLARIYGYLDFRAALAKGPLAAITCFAGTTVQEIFATSEPIRAACGASITDHATRLAEDFTAAIARHRPRMPVTAESLALYTQTTLQGGFVIAKATNDHAPLLDAITHLRNYLTLLFEGEHAMTTGSFIWYELMTPDPDAAAKFYGAVLGWTIAPQATPTPDSQDYRMIMRSDGGSAGGVLRLTPTMQQHGAQPGWLGYLQVQDVDAATQAILADGGQLHMRADLPVGRIAMVTDPMGTPFYVMTPVPPPDKPDATSDVFDPAAVQRVRWNELASPDLAQAKAFYAKHFGFQFNEAMPMGPLGDYCFIDQHGVRIGAIMQKPPAPDTGPGCAWLFYFGVPSASAACRAIVASGGRVLQDLHEVPGGDWIAVATDPAGAVFGIVGPRGE